MKKKILAAAAALMAAISLTACTEKCKQDGCDEDAKYDGYCQAHAILHGNADAIKDAAGDLLGGLGL